MVEFEQERSGLIRRLVTILSADVAGYSLLMQQDESGTLRVFREHKRVFENLVKEHRGRVFNTAGDAILAEFPSAVEAVRCATEIQSALATANERLPETQRVRFRIGINLGDVIEQGTDLLGDGVNVAARLQTAAEPGGVCISGSVYDQIVKKLSLEVKALGEQEFKNIEQRVRTFSIVSADGNVKPLPVRKESSEFIRRFERFFPQLVTFALAIAVLVFVFRRGPEAPPAPPPTNAAAAPAPLEPLPVPAILPTSEIRAAPSERTGQLQVNPAGPGPRTIGEAIEAAKPGDQIDIAPGSYREHFSLKKNVTLRGLPGADGAIAVRIENKGDETISVEGASVRLESLAVIFEAAPEAKFPAAVVLRSGKLVMKSVTVLSAGQIPSPAFSLQEGEAQLTGSRFRGRRGVEQLGGSLLCIDCVADENQEEGAIVMNQTGKPSASEFRNFRANRNGTVGFVAFNGGIAKVTGCELRENKAHGASVLEGGEASFTGCNTGGNGENGVVVAGNGKLTFSQGKASGNKQSGAAATNKGAMLIRDSELSDNGEYGYVVLEQATASESKNHFGGNKGGPAWRAPASVPVPAAK